MVAAQEGIEVTDAQVNDARDELVSQLGGEQEFRNRLAQQGVSKSFVMQQLRDQQIQQALQQQLGADADLGAFVQGEIADVPIRVNPRYGEWDPQTLAVTPFQPLAQAEAPQDAATQAPRASERGSGQWTGRGASCSRQRGGRAVSASAVTGRAGGRPARASEEVGR